MKCWDIKANEKSFHAESFTDMMPILLNSKYFGRNLRNFNIKVEFISGSLFDHINAGVVGTIIHDLCLIKCLKILYCMECCAKWFTYCRDNLELFYEIKLILREVNV